MDKNAKIYVAGHRGLVGSAIVKNLQSTAQLITKLKCSARRTPIRNRFWIDFFWIGKAWTKRLSGAPWYQGSLQSEICGP